MTARATVRQARANSADGVDVAVAITIIWSLSLVACELTLKDLSPAPNRAEGIAVDDE